MSEAPRAVVFTDLDGTLLDAETYDPTPARDALERLLEGRIPVVPVTSKTLAETERWAERLGLGNVPLVVESGGALRLTGGRVELVGTPYTELRAALAALGKEIGRPLLGFGDLTEAEVAARTGLAIDEARDARLRLADEPFFADPPLTAEESGALARAAERRGLHLEHGGRFLHLLGRSDKGKAVTRVLAWYESRTGQRPYAVGIGDAANDRAFLAVVDRAFAVRRPDGSVARELAEMPGIRITDSSGPRGFDEAIRLWLTERTEVR
jgi:mannosyl-3-phosphoglycerate phosphatase